MIKLYTSGQIARRLDRYHDWIDRVSEQFRIPSAAVRAVLRREMAETDLLDPVADAAVRLYWLRWRIRKGLFRLGLVKDPVPQVGRGALGKRDSSTGYGQIFAYVAINAANFGTDRGLTDYARLGLPTEYRMSPEAAEDLCLMWHLLHRDPKVNIALSALNLVSAAEEMNGHRDFARYTPEEYQLAFTRYNANVRHITAYGRAVYQLFLQESQSKTQNRRE